MRKIPMRQKIYIGMVEFSQFMATSIITNAMLIFYTDYVGLERIALYSLAIVIFGVWDAINEPIFGFLSDKKEYKAPWGKRRPLMLLGIPLIVTGFCILIFAPPDSSDMTLFIILIIGLCVFDTGKAINMVNYEAFSMQIADHPDERTKLFMVARYVTLVPGAIVGLVPTYFLTGDYTRESLMVVFLLIVIPLSLMSMFAVLKIEEPADLYIIQETEIISSKELESGLKADVSLDSELKLNEALEAELESQADPLEEGGLKVGDDVPETMNLIQSIFYCLKSDSFRYFIGYRMIITFAQATYLVNVIYIMNWIVGIGGVQAVIISGAGGFVINLLYPILTKAREKYGTVRSIQGSLCIALVGYGIMFFSMGFWDLFVGYSLSSFTIGSLYLFANVMLADIADEDTLKTGKQRQAIYASISALFGTIASSLAVALLALILDIFGYSGTAAEQTAHTILGIRIGTTVVPMIAAVLSIIVLQFYPLQGKRYAALRKQIMDAQRIAEEQIGPQAEEQIEPQAEEHF